MHHRRPVCTSGRRFLALDPRSTCYDSRMSDAIAVVSRADLVDPFAIRAVDDLARALLALALGRPEAVPATCAGTAHLLGPWVARAKAALED